MTRRQIIERDWQSFADAFSTHHSGWLISIYVDDPFGGREYLARSLPFLGMTVDDDEESALLLLAGERQRGPFGHVIHEVRRVLVDEANDGHAVTISVFSSRGPVTVMELRELVPVGVEEPADELAGVS